MFPIYHQVPAFKVYRIQHISLSCLLSVRNVQDCCNKTERGSSFLSCNVVDWLVKDVELPCLTTQCSCSFSHFSLTKCGQISLIHYNQIGSTGSSRHLNNKKWISDQLGLVSVLEHQEVIVDRPSCEYNRQGSYTSHLT